MTAWMKKYWRKTTAIILHELHANASPLRASLSLSLGILIGVSPFYGLHIVTVVPLAFLFRLNRPLALLGVSVTILPVVPFWIAAGLFTGKLVISRETADSLIEHARESLPLHLLDRFIDNVVAFCRHVFPDNLFDTMLLESGHGIMAGFVQWFIGCSVLAAAAAAATFCITYPLFIRLGAAMKKRRGI